MGPDRQIGLREEPAGLAAAAQRVLASTTFSRAPRLREFLSFVVRCALENRQHEVNEYSLGVQVFGKSPNYNPSLDNIVRVTARQLRQKLNEYYSSEGVADPWRLEIPKGSYGPVVAPNVPSEAPTEIESAAPVRRWLHPVAAVCAALALGGWAAAAWLWWSQPHNRPQPAYLLTAILADRSHPVTVVLDDPVLSRVWPMIGEMMTVDEIAAGRFLDPSYYKTSEGNYLRGMLGDNYFVHFSSLKTLSRISEIAQSHGVEAIPIACRTLQPERLASGNLVFVGGVGGDPWVAEIQKHLAFEHRVGAKEETRSFANREPRGGEPAIFESNINDKGARYYTRIALLKNPFGTGRIALLGGTSRMATEAASQFAFSQNGVDTVQKLCGAPLERLEGFEVLLETKALAGTAVTRTVVASRCKL